jgi:hypothetical protein
MSTCDIIHGDPPFLIDEKGCHLPDGHDGPHEYIATNGKRIAWETYIECNCAHCRRCEGDYCTIYWEVSK